LDFQIEITVPDPKHRKLVVCLSRMFYYEQWQVMLASLEFYKLLGADLMVIPILSVVEKLHQILKGKFTFLDLLSCVLAYENEGTVRLKPAIHIPQFVSKKRQF
jgi:hypothetical protein